LTQKLDARGADVATLVREFRPPGGFMDEKVRAAAREIVREVRERGDTALLEYTERFDGVRPQSLRVPEGEISRAAAGLEAEVREAFAVAIENVRRFHAAELDEPWQISDGGAIVGQRVRPLERAGIYVPGGHGAYPSSLVMAVVPAQVAGVEEIAVCTPPGPGGRPNEAVLAVAGLLGLEEVYAAGGAQAIGALAYGTQSLPAVQKIVGPGNAYVTAAKLEVFGAVGIDAPQGPSEVVVIADGSASPEHVACDLMAQAEHLSGASAILLTPDAGLVEAVEPLLSGEPADLVSLVRVESLEQAVGISNAYAPEHAHVLTADADAVASKLANAGCVMVGDSTPVALGDYAAGPSHALPTGGTALWASPLGTHDFTARTNFIRYDAEALRRLGPHVVRLARLEGFENHARSVEVRLDG
jgi:histidinol dehydrogenase